MEKRGLTAALQASGAPEAASIFWGDEMRLGLIGQVRRVWASVGVKVVQPVEFTFTCTYLNLAVNGLTGKLLWTWADNMQAATIAPVLQAWATDGLDTLVWDCARGHRGEAYAHCPVKRVEQPPYSPELNPAERIFEYLRAKIEGLVYGSLDKKKAAVERELLLLAKQPEAVTSLAGWHWIRSSVNALPGSP